MTAPAGLPHLTLARLGRAEVQPYLPQLSEWLLPDQSYGVQHTWPQLYRSDGDGTFLVLRDADRLVAHCAFRIVTVRGERDTFPAALLGSVATAPDCRGQGLAGRLLGETIATARTQGAAAILLWAERPDLYARAGFAPGPTETCALLARRPHPDHSGMRLATVDDHAQLHALHALKPWRVERSLTAMSALLTTPGMWTFVRERQGRITAYACCGKGADLQGFWHEVGGSDTEIAELLMAAMHELEQTDAMLLPPPYRPDLLAVLGRHVVEVATVPGPMVLVTSAVDPGRCWIDGLDSV
ncbi:MAG: GNAT family N-acetyltransferase [Planctomycetes bacterium]|nr:GNAT family N-acetyltransferase [Planctomycetota bacterium]